MKLFVSQTHMALFLNDEKTPNKNYTQIITEMNVDTHCNISFSLKSVHSRS